MNFRKKNIFNYTILHFSIFCKHNILNLIDAEEWILIKYLFTSPIILSFIPIFFNLIYNFMQEGITNLLIMWQKI